MKSTVGVRWVSVGALSVAAVLGAACDDGGGDDGAGGEGADDGSDDGSGATTGSGLVSGSGASDGGSEPDTFVDMPGQIRFANFVSDGTDPVDLDLYWGATIDTAEFVETVEYGEVTDYLTPRQSERLVRQGILDADEVRYFLVVAGDTESLPDRFLVNTDEVFEETTQQTLVMSFGEVFTTDDLVVSQRVVREDRMVPPPADEAYVYVSSGAFDQIPEGDFVQVAADGVCGPETVSSTANTGQAFVLAPGTTGVYLVDANTECATGSSPADGSVEGGGSYLLIGKADTFEFDAREAVLVEVPLE